LLQSSDMEHGDPAVSPSSTVRFGQ
jgi:hypothetical protein